MFGGHCPVQGQGQLDDQHWWYFRARHRHWSFEVWDVPFKEGPEFTSELPDEDPVWCYGAQWGEKEHDAGYMPHYIAEAIIEWCFQAWDTWSRLRSSVVEMGRCPE